MLRAAVLSAGRAEKGRSWGGGKGLGLQFLERAVRDVVATPVRDRVELDAVGELHLVLLVEPAALAGPLGVRFLLLLCRPAPGLAVVVELVLLQSSFGVGGAGTALAPAPASASSLLRCRGGLPARFCCSGSFSLLLFGGEREPGWKRRAAAGLTVLP